ncbi:hypothetical protein J2X20_000457 [Pelomonas saccharophila]|uniref:Uncharacterized protein n=1 Tax=Roseateles saccharophilus TaxID=304 RepID=A0ABU1YG44_ROSSA|nr:hypothetical protein [Roseateles saccharophilus]MDR7267828.1 hypothetical protein [Roseateles saccharophilus]
MKAAVLPICCTALMSISAAHASSICWVEDVLNRSNEVEVLFGSSFVHVVSAGVQYSWSDRKLKRFSMTESTMLEGGLRLKPGDTAFLDNGGHHSRCELEVVEKDGKLAIKLKSFDHLPGMPAESAVKTVMAR